MKKILILSSIITMFVVVFIMTVALLIYSNEQNEWSQWSLWPQWLSGINYQQQQQQQNSYQFHQSSRRYHFDDDDDYDWYDNSATIYEIFPASFRDSNGDGYGDFNGITERVDYLRSLNIQAIRLNSIFAAFDYPKYLDNVLNFYDVDPHLGNFQSFNNMIQILHSNQIRVILDLNPTITSDEHPWSMNQTTEYENYYYFKRQQQRSSTTTTKALNSFSTNLRQTKNPDYASDYADGDYIDDDNLNGDFVHQRHPSHDSVINHPDDHFVVDDDDEEPPGGRWLNWSNEAIPKQMLKIADFWLRYVDGIYLKNLDRIHINDDDSGGDNPSGDNIGLIKREKILLEFLQRLRRISDGYQQQQQQQKSTKKILICSSHLLSPLLTANRRVAAAAAAAAKRRRQTSSSFQQNHPPLPRPHPNHQNEFRPEFDELDMNDFFDNPITDDDQNDDNKNIDSDSDSEQQSISSGYRKIHASANSQKMLPSSDSTSTSSLSTSIVNHGHHNQSLSIRSIYHYFDLVHFELIIRPNHIDTIRDQVNFVFLNRPADFPTIMWSLGGNSGHRHQRRRRPLYRQLRLANRIGSSNYSLACLFMLTMMPGTIMIFYGDEIGLTNLYNQNQQNHHHYHYRHN
uniref:alpha-glucosidase n=1 Tax=Dermatophagoides pteronyssinus TaxID=6956 RepID=A0A6P6YL49_DERPT